MVLLLQGENIFIFLQDSLSAIFSVILTALVAHQIKKKLPSF